MESPQILFVSKGRSTHDLDCISSENHGWQLETIGSGWEALERARSGRGPNLILIDLHPADCDGLHILRWLRRVRPDLPVILLSSSHDPEQKLEAIRSGAQDYLVRPLQPQQLETAIRRSLCYDTESTESEIVTDEIEQIDDDSFFVAASPIMRKLHAQAELLAQVNAPVLILGENGSGKELAARLIHKLSVRSGTRFLKVDCSALSGDALENELFGSGNGRNAVGKLELCHRGTLFLDEITEIPLSLQIKLLHVLQYGYGVRQGTDRRFEVDVRILAASQANIEQALAEGRLRQDFYYRLSTFIVHVPALRQRREEIPQLLSHFMNRLAARYSLPFRVFSPTALKACQQHSWPGNLRELEKFAKRYLVIGDGGGDADALHRDEALAFWNAYVPADRREAEHGGSGNFGSIHRDAIFEAPATSGLKSLIQSIKGEAERSAIASALDQAGWNRKAAARMLKISYRTLLYKIEQYRMSPPLSHFSG